MSPLQHYTEIIAVLQFFIAVVEGRVSKLTSGGHFKKRWVRLLAVAVCLSTMTTLATVNWAQAVPQFTVQLGVVSNVFKDGPVTICEKVPAFMQRWLNCFLETGDVKDAPRAGRPPKIPDAEARLAAEIFCGGYTTTINVDGAQVPQRKYYSSLPEAIAKDTRVQNLVQQRDATSEQLLNAIHRVAPEVKQHSVTFRHMLSSAEKAHRWNTAGGLLARHRVDPSLLDRMVFIDETTILTQGLKREHIKVWVNTSDTSFKDFTSVPGKPSDPVKAHVIAAVSAHPYYQPTNGLVYMEFTTGTTNIKRLHNLRQDGSTTTPSYVYTVGAVTLCELV